MGMAERIRGMAGRIRGDGSGRPDGDRIYGQFERVQMEAVRADIEMQLGMLESNTDVFRANYKLAKQPGNNVPFRIIESQLAGNAGALSAYEAAGLLSDGMKSRLSANPLYGQLKAYGDRDEPEHICGAYKRSKSMAEAGLALQGIQRDALQSVRRLPDLPGSEYGSSDDEYGY